MADDVYLRLREFLDKLPGGYPSTDSGVEIRILEKLFTPEEAEMATKLGPMPEQASAIAERCGMDESKASELLESMAKQGSIRRLRMEDQVYYMALQFVIGIYEFHVNTLDRELAEMVEEYMPYLSDTMKSTETQQLRVVPVDTAIDDIPAVATYDRVRNLMEEQDLFAVAPCICRKEQGLLGHECERPHETCLVFGVAAQYYIENGIGREITAQEADEILDLAEESSLVLSPTNAQDIVNICCCCECCCAVLRMLKSDERPADYVNSSFQAVIDRDLCVSCGTCLERCQIEAIEEGDEFNEVDPARCIGCGLCVPNCPEEAISLVDKPDVVIPPANVVEMSMQITKERSQL